MTAGRLSRTRAAGSALALIGLVVGIPVVLALLAGWPLPRRLPSLDSIRSALENGWVPDSSVVIKAIALMCWLAWVEIASCVLVEVFAAVRGFGHAPRVPLAGMLQPRVANLVTSVFMFAASFGPVAAQSATPSLAALVGEHRQTSPRLELVSARVELSSESPTNSESPRAEAPHGTLITVHPRDSLWDLAEEHLGDPVRWKDIWELNQSRLQPDGKTFSDPRMIRPGWVLELPGPLAIVTRPETSVSVPETPHPSPSGRATPEPGPETADSLATFPKIVEQAPTGRVKQANAPGTDDSEEMRSGTPPISVRLPGGSVVALSLASGVAAALATIRLRRRRNYRPSSPGPAVLSLPDGAGLATRTLVHVVATEAAAYQGVLGSEPSTFAFRGLHDPAPGKLVIGEREGLPFALDLAGLGGIGLTGEGSEDVGRSIVSAILAKGGSCVTEVIAPKPMADRLFASSKCVEGLRLLPSLDEVLREAEIELLRRARVLDASEKTDFADYQESDEGPLPAMTLLIDRAAEEQVVRIQTIALMGKRLGVGLIAVGTPTCCAVGLEVDAEGLVVGVNPGESAQHCQGVRLHRMTQEESAEVVGLLVQARTEEAVESDASVPVAVMNSEVRESANPAFVPAAGSLVEVRMLGTYKINAGGSEIRTGLRASARELLAYYLLRPQGATAEAAIDALWPDTNASTGKDRFWTALGNLRSATGVDHALIIKSAGTYAIEPGVFDVDLWRLQDALGIVQSSNGTKHMTIKALTAALSEMAGDLLEGCIYGWAEPIREEVRRRSLDACVRLAQLLLDGNDREAALSALQQGIRIDPYAEDLYQRALQLLDELQRPDVARRLFRELGARLAELDADPEDETKRLLKNSVSM